MTTGNGPPDRLSDRHYALAYMLVNGVSQTEIARRLGYTVARVNVVVNSPQMRALVADLRKERHERAFDAFEALVTPDEDRKSLQRLVELRDQDENRAVAATMTNSYLDRRWPKRTAHEEDRTVRITFAREDVEWMRAVQGEYAGDRALGDGDVLDEADVDLGDPVDDVARPSRGAMLAAVTEANGDG